MNDLKFDINKMDLIVENGDFVITNILSEQNGGLILNTKNINLYLPLIGVDIQNSLNNNVDNVNALLDKWQQQVIADGAKSAKAILNSDGTITATCNYE